MSASELMLDVGQANELKDAFRRGNWTNAEIKELCKGKLLTNIREVILGNAEIIIKKHIIDCNVQPFIPRNLEIEEHEQQGGQFKWSIERISLHLVAEQESGSPIEGNKLRRKLRDEAVLNANVLDYLLKNPQLIPEDWKEKSIFFWGTIYRDSDGYLYVCCLRWPATRWEWSYRRLDLDWYNLNPAVLNLSNSKERTIDCDADPFIPDGWKVEEHQPGGNHFKLDVSQIIFHLEEEQKKGSIKSEQFCEMLQEQPVLNANVLDYLLEHPQLIPEDWKGKNVFFCGTTYRDLDGDLCVRCLGWDNYRWHWYHRQLGHHWYRNQFVAIIRK